jgi:hypothetical protein
MSKTRQVLSWVMVEMVRGMTATETVDVSSTRGASNTLLSGRWLAIARVVWVLVFVAMLAAFFIQIPYYLAYMSRACPDTCGFTTQQEAALASIGISLDVFAWIALSCTLVISLISVVLALILFWRRSNDWMAMLVALFLVGYPIMNNGTTGNLPTDIPPSLWVLLQVLTFPVWIIYAATFMLFPSGRFAPHWTWILFIFWSIWGQLISLTPDLFEGILFLGYPLFVITTIIWQVYRYRHSSTPVQRQQTKWAIAGLFAVLVANQLFWLPSGFTPLGQTLYMPASFLFYQLVILALPITFFIAIQRNRLYDIDTIINRALVYGSVTVVLAAAYAGCIIAFQAISRTLVPIPGGPDEPITIVISTLLIAALFQPLRRRVQRAVDRRFYRTKYDARKAVEAFGATLRQEVDIASFRERLLAVVQQTMEPRHVSLWLKDPSPRKDG